MLQRSITGFFIVLFTVAFVLLKQVSNLFFDAFALIIMYVSLYEVIGANKIARKKINALALYFVPILVFLAYYFAESTLIALLYNVLIVITLFVYLMTVDIIEFAIHRRNNTTEKNISVLNQSLFDKTKNSLCVYAYPIFPLTFIFAINHLPYELGYVGIVLMFSVAMMTDTMAYLVGKFFGKKKFIPEVSPKKTIAGVFGGFLGGIIAALACFFIFYYTDIFFVLNMAGKTVSLVVLLIIGFVGSFITQLGDLVASALKRKVGIKDFSNVFPGHGGFMDRVDGLMFVSVFVYVVLTMVFIV